MTDDPSAGMTDAQLVALVQGSPLVHFTGFVTIEDKDHKRIMLNGQEGNGLPNILQRRIAEAYDWCIENGIPARLMVLKPRQKGSSTFTGHLCYHHARRFHCDGMIIGDEGSRTEKAWQIFTDYSRNDTFPWDSRVKFNTEKCTFTYKDGSKGLWERDTANDPKAGIGGTRQVLWLTEAARYAKSGARADTNMITAVLSSLAKVANSLAVVESTPEGAAGWFFTNWQGCATLRQAKKMKLGNGWIKIFAAWFEFEDSSLPRIPMWERYFGGELTAREKRGIELYKWNENQIAWRRATIESECAGSEQTFDQDFPEDEVSCFMSSGRPRFDIEGVARLEIMAKAKHHEAELGVLQRAPSGEVVFMPRKDGWLWVSERPAHGQSYISFIDPCTGEQSKGAKDPDMHSAGIVRQAGMKDGKPINTALAAIIHVPNGCRWEDSQVAEKLVMLADYYGGTMIVPETGNGLGVLAELRRCGARIYQREKFDHINPGKTLSVPGWETNGATRDLVVNAIADAIREQTIDIAYQPAVAQLRTFVENDRGKAEARSGAHDDHVMGIGIACACIRFSSVYRAVNSPQSNDYGRDSYRSSQGTDTQVAFT